MLGKLEGMEVGSRMQEGKKKGLRGGGGIWESSTGFGGECFEILKIWKFSTGLGEEY